MNPRASNNRLPAALAALPKLRGMLSQAKNLRRIVDIRNTAEAARMQAKRIGLDIEIQIDAAEVRLQAERRAGHRLMELQLPRGGRPGAGENGIAAKGDDRRLRQRTQGKARSARRNTDQRNRYQDVTGLERLGLTKVKSARWQKLARVPEKEFQRYVAEARAARRVPTTAGLLELAERLLAEGRLLKSPRARDRQVPRKPATDTASSDVRKLNCHNDLGRTDEEAFILSEMHSHIENVIADLADYFRDDSASHLEHIRRQTIERRLLEVNQMLRKLGSGGGDLDGA